MNAYPLTIYYDASCPLCNGEMTNLMLRNVDNKLVFIDASAPGFVSPLPGLTQADLLELIHAQKADGEIIKSVEVFRLAYSAVGLSWITAASEWPVFRQLADHAYPWLARNRHHIPRGLVRLLFEGPTRRAAERASLKAHCTSQTCKR